MKKEVKFNYFVTADVSKVGKNRVNLTHVLDNLVNKYQIINSSETTETSGAQEYSENQTPTRNVYSWRGEQAKLESISKDEDFYFMVFERLRAMNLPTKTTIHSSSKNLGLGDNEFLAEQVVALYDPTQHVLMIQKNRDSLSPRGIETFIASLLEEYVENNDTDLRLAILCEANIDRSRIIQNTRKLTYRTSSTENYTGRPQSLLDVTFSEIEEDLVPYDYTVEITITAKDSFDGGRNPYLPPELVEEVVVHNGNNLSKLAVKTRNSSDELEEINLLNYQLVDSHVFEVNQQKRRITPNMLILEMRRIYEESGRQRVVKSLGNEI